MGDAIATGRRRRGQRVFVSPLDDVDIGAAGSSWGAWDSRAGAGALVFSKEAPDVLWGMARCVWSLGALPELMVWDREGCLHAGGGRPTESYAGFCGLPPVDW
ncbi:MAG: hypothetical protein ACXVHQ_30345 [Solirubrobacteraceae bacterium]